MNSDNGKGDAESKKGRPVERKASMEHFWNSGMVRGGGRGAEAVASWGE